MSALPYVLFLVGGRTYALETAHVKEIHRMKELRISPVPRVGAHILGIVNLRGDIIPVMDLRAMFEAPTQALSRSERMLVVNADSICLGLVADAVLGNRKFALSQHQPAEEALQSRRPAIKAVIREEGLTCFVLDHSQLY